METQASIKFDKHPINPIPSLATQEGTWKEDASMTVDLIQVGNDYLIYYVGKSEGKDCIGVARCSVSEFDGVAWKDEPDNPILAPGEVGSFDDRHLVDPASVRWQGSVYLYYSALGAGPDSIGLAISDDGISFDKHPEPVIVGRAPEVVVHDGLIHMLYSMENPQGGYEFHLATSEDGFNFKKQGPVFKPSESGWDSLSVVTPRILSEEGIYILTYAGDRDEKDYPTGFGLAFSQDLRNWIKYPRNPVMSVGGPGEWDSRAVWFPEMFHAHEKYYMWYEGYDGDTSRVGLAISQEAIAEIGHNTLGLV